MPLFSPFCPHSGLSRCSGPAGVVPRLLANQDREEGRNGSPVAPVAGGPDAPEGIKDRGTETLHHPTKRGTQQDQLPRWCRSCADAVSQSGTRAHKDRGKEGVRNERKGRQRSGATTSPQAHKKGYPPLLQGAANIPPHHKFAPKNQQKVALGRFEKIFGKIFRGNVSGERKTPRVVSTEGVLTNENREISNLGDAITKNAQKHYLITKGKGR